MGAGRASQIVIATIAATIYALNENDDSDDNPYPTGGKLTRSYRLTNNSSNPHDSFI